MTTWLLLAGGLLLYPPAPAPSATGGPKRDPPSRRALQALACLAAAAGGVVALGPGTGLVLAPAVGGCAWLLIGLLHGRAPRRLPRADLALALDLVAAALRSGQPLATALLLAAPVADPHSAALLTRVGGLLRLGADPSDAWAAVAEHSGLQPVAAAAARSADSGIRLAAAFDRLAADLRANAEAVAAARAQRAGVLAVAPLGLCFLPAFVCLGIVPVVIGIAGRALGSLR